MLYITIPGWSTRAAVPILEEVIELCQQIYGPHHRRTLDVRLTHVRALGRAGDPAKAALNAAQLLDESRRLLGDDHYITLHARSELAEWTTNTDD